MPGVVISGADAPPFVPPAPATSDTLHSHASENVGQLYVVSTPIGNLGDLTFRALDVLRTVSLIVAEDTRHSRTLLDHYAIRTPVSAYHEHNEARETPKLIGRLQAGDSIALISDAGTPLLSDPGGRLVRACADAGLAVVPVPGASALLAALVASGIAADRFTFYGFLDRKGKARVHALAEIARSAVTSVLYESPNRVGRTLADLVEAGAGTRQVAIARELTKRFEEVRRGTVAELAAAIGETTVRGEVVLVIEGASEAPSAVDDDSLRALATQWRADGASPRDILGRLTQELGVPRNLAYRIAHERTAEHASDDAEHASREAEPSSERPPER
jgi:16S rRNA (cytidine1402-2'-O)-methyltransferase